MNEELDYESIIRKFAELVGAAAEELEAVADCIASIFRQALDAAAECFGELMDLLSDFTPIAVKPRKRWHLQRKGVGCLSESKTRPMTHRPEYG